MRLFATARMNTCMNRAWGASLALAAWVCLGAVTQAADATHGQQVFQICASCHTDTHGGGDIGPTLVGVIGRKAGSRDDYRYSGPMSRASFVWDEAKLRTFIHAPQETVKGTRMPFGGLEDFREIDDLLAYLATQK